MPQSRRLAGTASRRPRCVTVFPVGSTKALYSTRDLQSSKSSGRISVLAPGVGQLGASRGSVAADDRAALLVCERSRSAGGHTGALGLSAAAACAAGPATAARAASAGAAADLASAAGTAVAACTSAGAGPAPPTSAARPAGAAAAGGPATETSLAAAASAAVAVSASVTAYSPPAAGRAPRKLTIWSQTRPRLS